MSKNTNIYQTPQANVEVREKPQRPNKALLVISSALVILVLVSRVIVINHNMASMV